MPTQPSSNAIDTKRSFADRKPSEEIKQTTPIEESSYKEKLDNVNYSQSHAKPALLKEDDEKPLSLK